MKAEEQFLSLLFICCASVSARQGVCDLQDEICGTGCYDPTKFDCMDGVKCEKGQESCGSRCYSPETEDCWKDEGSPGGPEIWDVCPLDHVMCKKGGQYQCYDIATQQCHDSGAICSHDEEGCGWACYSPKEKSCLSGKHSSNVLCNVGDKLCGFTCYDPKDATTTCPEGGEVLCKPGESSCGYQCFSPESGSKCFNGDTLCEPGQQNCGFLCYDPKTEVCFNDKQVCGLTREPCGDIDCYDPKTETCYTGSEGYGGSACPKELKACGYECYDPKEKSCLAWGDRFKILCGLDAEVCNQRCHELPDEENRCLNDVLCKKDEEVCGRHCYKPRSGVTCHNGETLCRDPEKPCGRRCYNPDNVKCVDLPDVGGFGEEEMIDATLF